MTEDRPPRKGLLDEMDELERKRKAKKDKKKADSDDEESGDLDLSRIG